MFAGLTLKQEEDNRRLKEENLAIRRQMVELEKEKWEQNNRTEQLMGAMLRQLGGQVVSTEPGSAEMTPVRGSRPVVVVPENLDFLKERAVPSAFLANFGRPSKSVCVCVRDAFQTLQVTKFIFGTLILRIKSHILIFEVVTVRRARLLLGARPCLK